MTFKFNKKNLIFIISLLFGFYSIFFLTHTSSAQLLDAGTKDKMDQQATEVQLNAGYDSTATIGSVVATVIKAFLGLLGIIFIFLMVLAGYHWMTAAGDEQKVTKAKDTIRTAIIGLIIIVAAYSITYFVLKALGGAGGPIGGGT